MNTALVIIGLSMLIFLVVFYLKRAKEKRKAWLEEREKIKEYGENIRSMMSDAAKLSVPLVVDVGIGDSWQEAH
jgi:multisubunit Na+/H+ antiporter MnhB subunit